jgi:hypothetical protein
LILRADELDGSVGYFLTLYLQRKGEEEGKRRGMKEMR